MKPAGFWVPHLLKQLPRLIRGHGGPATLLPNTAAQGLLSVSLRLQVAVSTLQERRRSRLSLPYQSPLYRPRGGYCAQSELLGIRQATQASAVELDPDPKDI